MKKIVLIFSLLLLSSSFVLAQKCKYKINEVDKFTNKFTKLTKSEKVIGTFFTEGEFSVKKVDTSYYFVFDYSLSSYSNFEPYTIQKGAKIIFLFENGEQTTIHSSDDIKGIKKTVVGLPPVYVCKLTNVSYELTRGQIDMFFKSKIKSIRFYRTESNGKEDFVDNEIKDRNQDDIQKLIKCIL